MGAFYPKPIANINSLFQKPTEIRNELFKSDMGERSPESFTIPKFGQIFSQAYPRRRHKISRLFKVSLLAQLKISHLESSFRFYLWGLARIFIS